MVGDWCCDKHGYPMQITNVGDDYAYATFEGNEGDPWGNIVGLDIQGNSKKSLYNENQRFYRIFRI